MSSLGRPSRLLSSLAGAVLGACVQSSAKKQLPVQPAAPQYSEKLLEDLTLLATGELHSSDQTQRDLAELHSGRATVESYIDGLLREDGFAERVAPAVLLGD